jgi:hypothetical protein
MTSAPGAALAVESGTSAEVTDAKFAKGYLVSIMAGLGDAWAAAKP